MEKVRPWCGQPLDQGQLRKDLNTLCQKSNTVMMNMLTVVIILLLTYLSHHQNSQQSVTDKSTMSCSPERDDLRCHWS